MTMSDYLAAQSQPSDLLSVVILTYNEEIHIGRCIRSAKAVARQVFVVDSHSTDRTVAIAKQMGAVVVQRKFSNQSEQFNWGLQNLPLETPWVMRLDADEYLEIGLRDELNTTLPQLDETIGGIAVQRKVSFMGKPIRHGGFGRLRVLRIWRVGKGHVEQRWMDEHVVVDPAYRVVPSQGSIVDDNLNNIGYWVRKHDRYATREAAEMLNFKYHLGSQDVSLNQMAISQAGLKRVIKEKVYSRLPSKFRSFMYFTYRYFFLLGFLDGKLGLVWHFLQGLWYRLLVDAKIEAIESKAARQPESIRQLLEDEYDIVL